MTENFAARRSRALLEFVGFTVFALCLKAALDVFVWRYAGPISLVVVLAAIASYMRTQNQSLADLGLVRLTSRKNYLQLPLQCFAAFFVIIATAVVVTILGVVSGVEALQPNSDGKALRFGDLAGNTPLFLFWLAILWIAGPAEELFFRGFMINKLRDILGETKIAICLSIVLPALIFGMGHMYYQGLLGLFTTGAVGISLGCLFFLFKRNIWPLMIAHACANSLGFTLEYLEISV